MYRFLARLKQNPATTGGKAPQSQTAPDASVSQWTAKQAVWWFLRDPSDLKRKEQETLLAIRQASPIADMAYGFAQDFMQMLRRREGQRLDVWLDQVRASHIPELQRFVPRVSNKIRMLYWRVSTPPWSNGIVEGKINKLKLDPRVWCMAALSFHSCASGCFMLSSKA